MKKAILDIAYKTLAIYVTFLILAVVISHEWALESAGNKALEFSGNERICPMSQSKESLTRFQAQVMAMDIKSQKWIPHRKHLEESIGLPPLSTFPENY